MALKIERKQDARIIKAIMHRVADISGGVTVCTSELGGSALLESTPLAPGSDEMYHVVKTAQIVTEAAADATAYEVAKGHHFKAGDNFATEACNGKKITSIDKSDPVKDIITLDATLGAVVKVGTCAFQSSGANKVPKYTANTIAGSSYTIEDKDNLFVDAWIMAVAYRSKSVVVCETIQKTLSGVHYV